MSKIWKVAGQGTVGGEETLLEATWRGDYDPIVAYLLHDTVSYLGSAYICIFPCTGIAPTDDSHWEIVVEKGDEGDTGASSTVAGPAGSTGPQGPQGIQGGTGSQGIQGLTGAASTVPGPQGEIGSTGPQGPQGVQGTAGATGSAGAAGAAGSNGTNGTDGTDGVDGDAFVYADFTEGQLAALVGAQGEQGIQGLQGTAGSNGTNGTDGTDGTAGTTDYTELSNKPDIVGIEAKIDSVRPFPAPVVTGTYAVPLTIEHTGATEVSAALNDFIATVPDGSIISFPTDAIYKIHANIFISDRNNLIFEGNGTTLQVDATAAGTSAYTSPFHIGDSSSDTNSDIAIHDFILIGNSPTPGVYTAGTEGQSNINVGGATRLEIYNITGSGAHGDFVDCQDVQGIWVHDCHAIDAGRIGFTVRSGSNVLVEDCAFDVSGYYTFDIEPDNIDDACSNITIRNNTAGTWGSGNKFLGIDGSHTGAVIDRITIDNNIVTGGSLSTECDNGGTAGTRMTRIAFTNNKSLVTVTMGSVLFFYHVDGLIVTGNVQPLGIDAFLTYFTDCTGLSFPIGSADGAHDLSPSLVEFNRIHGITAAGAALLVDANAAAQLITLLGATSATAAELNHLDGITATTAELNITDGVTATAAELNALDGITSTVTELNYTDGVTSAIQTQLNAKAAASAITNVDNTSDATKNAAAVVLTNKRVTRRVDTQATTDTITPEISTYDIFVRTAQAHALVINNHSSSTPVDGDMMLFEILSDATIRAITYGNMYVAKAGVALPAATVASKNLTLLFIWRNDLTQWVLLSAGQEA